MDLPAPDRRLLKPAPAQKVICQLRVDASDRASASDTGRRWAEELGDLFPRFDQLQGEVVTFQGGAEQPSPVITRTQERGWRFAGDDDTSVVTLLPGSVALETSNYIDWNHFSSVFGRVVELLESTVEPAVEQRVGLRYVNHLAPPGDVGDQVDSAVLGLAEHPTLGSGLLQLEQRAILQIDERIRASVRLQSLEATAPTVLDIDVFREVGRPFAAADVLSVMGALNAAALSLFQACLREDYLASIRARSGDE